MTYQTRLKEIREGRNVTVAEVAKLLDTTPRQVRLWESGERRIRLRHCICLAQFYNVSLDYMAGIIDTPLPLNGEKKEETVEDLRPFLGFYASLPLRRLAAKAMSRTRGG